MRPKRGYYLGKSPKRLDLFEARVDDRTRPVLERMRKAGLTDAANKLERRVREAADKEIHSLTEDALRTARRHVPIDSRELQTRHIHSEYRTGRGGLPEGTVFIDGDNHYGSRRRKPEIAAVLGLYLDDPDRPLRRSRTNGSHPEGTSTADWVEDAHKDFRARKAAIIRREI